MLLQASKISFLLKAFHDSHSFRELSDVSTVNQASESDLSILEKCSRWPKIVDDSMKYDLIPVVLAMLVANPTASHRRAATVFVMGPLSDGISGELTYIRLNRDLSSMA